MVSLLVIFMKCRSLEIFQNALGGAMAAKQE
jgi:hypothetical protein